MSAVKKREYLHSTVQPLRKKKIRRRKLVKKNKNKVKAKLNIIFSLIFTVGIVTVLLSRYASISKTKYDIASVQTNIDKLNSMKTDLKIELEEVKDSDWLIAQAEERINMRAAGEDQLVAVDFSKSKLQKTVETKSSNGVLGNVSNLIEKIFEK